MSNISKAAASNNHLDLLKAMRTRISKALDDDECPPRDLASLTRRLQDIAKEIDTLEERAKMEGTTSGTTGSGKATGRGKNWSADSI